MLFGFSVVIIRGSLLTLKVKVLPDSSELAVIAVVAVVDEMEGGGLAGDVGGFDEVVGGALADEDRSAGETS